MINEKWQNLGVLRRKKHGKPGEERRGMKERLLYRRMLKVILILLVNTFNPREAAWSIQFNVGD